MGIHEFWRLILVCTFRICLLKLFFPYLHMLREKENIGKSIKYEISQFFEQLW